MLVQLVQTQHHHLDVPEDHRGRDKHLEVVVVVVVVVVAKAAAAVLPTLPTTDCAGHNYHL